MGTSKTSLRPRISQTVPDDSEGGAQIFPSVIKRHQLPSGIGDPTKTESPESSSGLLIPPRVLRTF